MSRFKVGDKVQSIHDDDFAEVIKVSSNGDIKVFWGDESSIEHALENNGYWFADEFRLIESANEPSTTNPFLKIVTKVEYGTHYLMNGIGLSINKASLGRIEVDLEEGIYDKQSLAELARILNEISEVM